MTYIESLKDVKTKVQELLTKNANTRDSDNLLVATFYFYEMGGKEQLSKISAYDFLKKMSTGELTRFESISRARRKIQEDYPELRGNSYEKRKKSEEETRKNIKNI